MLNDFIKEYKDRYFLEFNDDFWGNLKKASQKLLEPKNHPSNTLKERLNYLNTFENEPVNVAVIGQFSSGKSTFLNTLFKDEVLPTGVVPVTAKTTTIKYSTFNLLKVKYFDKTEKILDISKLYKFTDQREKMEDVKSLTIYFNNEILKNFTIIDTPGLNSISDKDTNETLSLFDKIGAVLWVSLIDNAARASEIKDLEVLPAYLKNSSLSLLSQKDRLNKEEYDRVLKYSKDIFKKYFVDVVAISSKLEEKGDKDSGFSEVINFLNSLNGKKEEIVRSKFNEILKNLVNEREFYVKLYIKLEEILKDEIKAIAINLDDNLNNYLIDFEKIYNWINETATSISETFETCVESIDSHYFKNNKRGKLFSKKGYEKFEYKSPKFNKDFALSKLLYNDDKLATSFRIFRGRLNKFENEILDNLNSNYKALEDKVLLFKGRFESMSKRKDIYSDIENELAKKIISEVYELFLKTYERSFFTNIQNLKLFFEKIDIKVSTNYENAIKLSANLIEDRVLKSIKDYESDPLIFPLFYPNSNDFKLAILRNLNYYEFEDEFIGERTFIKRNFQNLKDEINQNLVKNLEYIAILKQKHQDIMKTLKEIVI